MAFDLFSRTTFRLSRNYSSKNMDNNTINVQGINSVLTNLNTPLNQALLSPQNMSQKGINIDDTTVLLTPSSHNPSKTGDTFPYVWRGTTDKITSIRTFHYNLGVGGKNWVLWAIKNGIKVLVGLDLSTDSGASEIASFSSDYTSASTSLKALYNANVIGIAIGNEETNTTSINTGLLNAQNLKGLNSLPNVPITSVLNGDSNWLQNTYPPEGATFTANFLTLATNMDIICFNFYSDYYSFGTLPPLSSSQALEVGLSWTSNGTENSVILNQFGSVRAAMITATINKQFWCTETGWASVPTQPEVSGWSSIANLQTYYTNFLGFSMSTPYTPQDGTFTVNPPDRIFYFCVRDVPTESNNFGLYTLASKLSPKF